MTEDEKIAQLRRDVLTDDFLAGLVELARAFGWSGDYVEVAEFVSEAHRMADKTPPGNLAPYWQSEPDWYDAP